MNDVRTERFDAKPVLLLVTVVTITFLARMLLSPLLLQIRAHYGLTHAEGGSLFLVLSVGYSVSVLLSGFVAERLHHRGTVLASAFVVAGALALIGTGPPFALFLVGIALAGVGAGLYGPSGIAMLTGVAQSQHWGRALALHEMGPILGFFGAPVLANLALRFGDWRVPFLVVAGASVIAGALFLRKAEGGRFPGARPSPRNIVAICSVGRFWIIAVFFVLAVGLEIGVYSMLPTFLVEERGLAEATTNTLVGASRLSALVLVFTSGWLADRIGAKRLIRVVALAAGLATVTIGLGHGIPLLVAVVLQPMLVAAFFPAGLIELSHVAPAQNRNLAIALVIPVANLFGAGAVPTILGYVAELGLFGAGFVVLGILMPAATVLLRWLPEERPREVTPAAESCGAS